VKVVIDTNVLVSAAFKDKNPEAIIRFVVAHPDFEWVVSEAILDEYKRVLARSKFGLPDSLLQQWYALLDSTTVIVDVPETFSYPPDPTDAKFLACALAADAEWLITGDSDFSHARKLVRTTILSVAMFQKLVCEPLA
jgi:putative PIN family toxin of toxin-antitoxin system